MGKSSKKKPNLRDRVEGDRPSANDENLKLNLSYEQLAVKDVEAYDGDSFFRAVSDQVYGVQTNYIEVKARVFEFIQLNKALIEEKNSGVESDSEEFKERERIRGVCFVYEKNLRVYNSKGKDIFETYPSDLWIYLVKYENGDFGSVRYVGDLGDSVPDLHLWFYESDRGRAERKEKMKMFSEYFVSTYNIQYVKKLTWILMKLFLYDATYTDIDNSYVKIVYFLEKYNSY